MVIVAEIADKMTPVSFFYGVSIVSGVSAGLALTFLKGVPRFIVFGTVALITCFCGWALQVDLDLIAATRGELGQSYLTVSRSWIFGSFVIAALLVLIFRVVLGVGTIGGAPSRRA